MFLLFYMSHVVRDLAVNILQYPSRYVANTGTFSFHIWKCDLFKKIWFFSLQLRLLVHILFSLPIYL